MTQHDALLDAVIAGGCNLTPVEINEAIVRLKGVVPADIERVVAGVPADWGITDAERTTLIVFLKARRESLINRYMPAQP